MPKSLDKTKGTRKRKKTPTNSNANTESDASDSKSCPKKKKTPKRRNCLPGIEMSKQLATEVQQKRKVRARTSTKNNSEPRLCGNGKPMPSLAELEAMYEDSDDEESPPPQTTSQTISVPTESCETPEQKPLVTDGINMNSPDMLKKLTSQVIEIITKTIVLDDDDDDNIDAPPPSVIPQKKPKKSDIPYIVGCKNRRQIPWLSKAKVGVDKEKYGIDPNQPPDDEDEKKKRMKRGTKMNLSKSIFNAKSDEIAERLKEFDTMPSTAPNSPDSTSILVYDYNSSVRVPRNFSPLPSTSNDTDVILENDRLFNKSLFEAEQFSKENSPPESPTKSQASPQAPEGSPDEVEVIDVPFETVIIDDSFPEVNVKAQKRKSTELDDDCCIIIESELKRKRTVVKADTPPKDDIYGSIDLTQSFDNEVYEIKDDEIDDLIAENQAILEKKLNRNTIDTVTFVDPNVVFIGSESKPQQTASDSQPSTSNSDVPVVSCPPASVDVECVEVPEQTINNINNTTSSQCSMDNEIAEVVNSFFSHPPPRNNSSCQVLNESRGTSTVDLTSSQETMMSRISSWIFSLESYLGGRSRRRNNSDQAVEMVDCQQNVQNSRHVHTLPQNNMRRPSNVNQSPQLANPLSENNGQSVASASTSIVTVPTATPTQHSQPQRSIGDCPICMDSLANNAVASTICGHVFCMACIKAAIKANGKKCPTCRKALKGVGYHQLFL